MTATLTEEQSQEPRLREAVLGVAVDAQTMDAAVARIAGWVRDGGRRYICVAAVHSVVEAQTNTALRAALEGAAMVTTDGMPLVWLCRLRGRRAERVYGPDLMLELCARGRSEGWRHAFIGATDDTLERLTRRLTARFPGLSVAGAIAPPFRPLTADEEEETVSRLNALAPDILWVGLGAPKQELWMARLLARLDCPVIIGVGAAFDFHAGTKRQAPRWLRRAGLEWLYRLASEPRRLGRRYLVGNTRFLALLFRDAWRAARTKRREEPCPSRRFGARE